MESAETPLIASAFAAASYARSDVRSVTAIRRSATPTRVRIHSSLVFILPARSSLVTMFDGTALPVPMILKLIPSSFNCCCAHIVNTQPLF